jgi:ribosomal-protein-alanine N-acetyltransferase
VQFGIERMRLEHIPVVNAIEQASFSQPWPARAYRKELQQNRSAYYYVVKRLDGPAFEPSELGLQEAVREPESTLVGRFARLFGSEPPAIEPDCERELCRVVGYGGLWLMADEAHVTTIAVHPKYRGEGVGELLLLHMIDTAKGIPARWLTLEVRKSNEVAQALYRKYTFKEMGVRRRYYSDNGEDAVVMWTDPIESETFAEAVARNRASLQAKLVNRA